jgi:hypothetical protein
MKTSVYYNDGLTVPYAFVTIGRQRVKQYGNTVYLNNGNEFEIELYNPTHNKVMAKIELNGVSLGSGIVLRPGERVFLERYLNEARKFLFETYEVDGNNPSVQKAIMDNGKVSVRFYNEYIDYGVTYSGWPSWETITIWPPYSPTFTCFNSTGGNNIKSPLNESLKTQGMANNGANSIMFSSTLNAGAGEPQMANNVEFENEFKSPGVPFREKDMSIVETGRIEKGSNSDQSFTFDNTRFNTYWTWVSEWKILPVSQKLFVREDIKVFCPNCGTRQKKSTHKFCSQCGTKF